MVYAFSEEDKKRIKQMGISVVQFKKMCYWITDIYMDAWNKIKDNPEFLEILKRSRNADT